jgi:hypothetical protein
LVALRREHLQSQSSSPASASSTPRDKTHVSFAQDKSVSDPQLPKLYGSRGHMVNTDFDDALVVTPDSALAMMVNLTPESTIQEILVLMSLVDQDDG